MRSFPLPIRVAAGLASTAIEQTRRLPAYLLGLPITVTSQVLQLSMRAQQQITELAIEGDERLADLCGRDQAYAPQPGWARFDEDEVPSTAPVGTDTVEDGDDDDVSDVAPGFDEMTLPQLRGKLRRLSRDDVELLLVHERSHAARPDFLRMLSNRLETLSG